MAKWQLACIWHSDLVVSPEAIVFMGYHPSFFNFGLEMDDMLYSGHFTWIVVLYDFSSLGQCCHVTSGHICVCIVCTANNKWPIVRRGCFVVCVRGQSSTPKHATCCVNLDKSPNSLSLSSCGESNEQSIFYFSRLCKNDMQYLKITFFAKYFINTGIVVFLFTMSVGSFSSLQNLDSGFSPCYTLRS